MMSSTLAEQFAKAKGAPVDVDGVLVTNMYRRTVRQGERIVISLSVNEESVTQGIRLKLSKGTVLVGDQELQDVVIWSDTAPQSFEVICKPEEAQSEFRLWNCWKGSGEGISAWIGNAGIIVQENGANVKLHCSAGIGSFDPSNLQVDLVFSS